MRGFKREPIGGRRRFAILSRDGFTCQFCSSKPGNERLHADHLIPHSKGGSDHDNNLVAACDRCNLGKGNRIAVPKSMLDGFSHDGWVTWKRWGDWHVAISDDGEDALLVFEPSGRGYWIPMEWCHDVAWHDDLQWKPWMHDAARAVPESPRRPRAFVAHGPIPLDDIDADDILTSEEALDRISNLDPAAGARWNNFCDAIGFLRSVTRRQGAPDDTERLAAAISQAEAAGV